MLLHRFALSFSFLLTGACGQAHGIGTCDETLDRGDACLGDWRCPPTSIGGSLAMFFAETRCSEGVVAERRWSEPYGWDGDAGPDAGAAPDGDAAPPGIDAAGWDAGMEPVDSGPPGDRSGVPCGGDVCVAGSEVCVACDTFAGRIIACTASISRDDWWEAMERVGCGHFGGAIAACDGPEDCGSGTVCGMSGGEAAYIGCIDAPADRWIRPCHDDADCPADRPVCSEGSVDDLVRSYVDPFEPELGWSLRACGVSS